MINKLGIQHNKIIFMRMTDQFISAKTKSDFSENFICDRVTKDISKSM